MKACTIARILLISILIGCQRNEYDANYIGKEYCACILKERNNGKDFFEARTMCDGSLLQENRFFRITYIEDKYGRYMIFLSKGLDDSAVIFRNTFNTYIEKNCCKVAVIGCDKVDELQKNRQAIDSIFKAH